MKKTIPRVVFCMAITTLLLHAYPADMANIYRSPAQIAGILQKKAAVAQMKLLSLGQSPGGRPIQILQVGSGDRAILVIANMEGNSPLASEAALALIDNLAGPWKAERENYTWFVCPVGNPDGYVRFFTRPLDVNLRNGKSFNEDNDDASDEDGPDDLNKDGWITMMRQAHPEGQWIPVKDSPALMRRADKAKGEKGVYRLFPEGLDNDGDGKINEDGSGGIIPGHNFPHRFKFYTRTDGPWSASEPESRALLRFAFDHPEIGLAITFGSANSLKAVPEKRSGAQASSDKVKVPERMSRFLGVEAGQEFPIKELLQIARDATGNQSLSEAQILQWMGGGAAMTPARGDAPLWKEVTEKYGDFLKKVKLDGKRMKSPDSPPGSFEEWAYYHYGVMSFSMDFWTLPEPKKKESKAESGLSADKVEKMSAEELAGLGEAKIDSLLKAMKAPAMMTAQRVLEGIKGGRMTPKRIAEMMRKATEGDEEKGINETEKALFSYDKDAFMSWTEFNHPTLGKVEIGGKKPFRDICPPDSIKQKLIEKQLPFVKKLASSMAKVTIPRVEVKKVGRNVWRVEAWVANEGFFAYPSHQGVRNRRPVNAIVEVAGKPEILEGRKRVVLGQLEGSGGSKKAKWLISGKQGSQITLHVETMSAGKAEKTITLKGGVQ